MTKKNNLFDLIKSLSPSEKRYFRNAIVHDGSDKKYLRLFDAMDEMTEYNEAAIRKRFKTEKFMRQLHVMKIYLQERIMKSLRNFHAGNSIPQRIKDCVKNIEIYFNKELFANCEVEIARAEKLARSMEDDLALIEILNWKRKLYQSKSPGDFSLQAVVMDQSDALARLMHNNKLWKELVGTNTERDFNTKPEGAPTLGSKVLAHHIQYRNAIRIGNNKGAKASLLHLVSELESRSNLARRDLSVYITTLNNLISFLVFTGEKKQALETVKKAKTFYDSAEMAVRNKSNFRLILRTYNIELEIYRDAQALDDAAALIELIVKMLGEHRDKVPASYLLSLWFQFAYIFFLRKDFKKSLHWINQILNSSFAEERKDLRLQSGLLNLMVHFELRNFFVMRYFVTNTKRLFSRNKALLPYHKIVLSFFIKISGAPEGTHPSLLQKLYDDLIVPPDIVPKNEMDYINWKNWLEGKIRRQ